jgi:hypothetical protein
VHVLPAGVVGSTAYGLADPDSDVDRFGVFAAPTAAFHGLSFPKESLVSAAPGVTYHEARTYARLALDGNPTIMELTWLPAYEVTTDPGLEPVTIRSAFLSAKRVREPYLGYASQQFRRLAGRGDGSFRADTRKRTAKHARHPYQLGRGGRAAVAAGGSRRVRPAVTLSAVQGLGFWSPPRPPSSRPIGSPGGGAR